MNKLYANFVALDMPEEYVKRLAESPQITDTCASSGNAAANGPVGRPAAAVGSSSPGRRRADACGTEVPMGLQVERGKVYLGAPAGQGHKVGDAVEILGKTLTVGRILPPHGTAEEDIAVCMHLADAQEVLDKPGRISEILCGGLQMQNGQSRGRDHRAIGSRPARVRV